jgi:hypothetical protein
MTAKVNRQELSIAYPMIAAARRIRPRRDGGQSFEQYFLYWTAFSDVYTTIAHKEGLRTRLKRTEDGAVVTKANGDVNIPEVVVVSESEQIHLALQAFEDDLKHMLILHEGTAYFVDRIPYWEGKKIAYDVFGQRVNGVINVHYTTDSQHPVWSPIDFRRYEAYLENPDHEENRNFLAKHSVDLLHTVSMNLMHAGRKFDDANDMKVFENALPMLKLIVISLIQ